MKLKDYHASVFVVPGSPYPRNPHAISSSDHQKDFPSAGNPFIPLYDSIVTTSWDDWQCGILLYYMLTKVVGYPAEKTVTWRDRDALSSKVARKPIISRNSFQLYDLNSLVIWQSIEWLVALNSRDRKPVEEIAASFLEATKADKSHREVKTLHEENLNETSSAHVEKDSDGFRTLRVNRVIVKVPKKEEAKFLSDGSEMGRLSRDIERSTDSTSESKDDKPFDWLFRAFARESDVTIRNFDAGSTIVDQAVSTSHFYR